jgi:hypothetical protein
MPQRWRGRQRAGRSCTRCGRRERPADGRPAPGRRAPGHASSDARSDGRAPTAGRRRGRVGRTPGHHHRRTGGKRTWWRRRRPGRPGTRASRDGRGADRRPPSRPGSRPGAQHPGPTRDVRTRCDLARFAVGRVDQDEAKIGVVAAQRDDPGRPHHVVVGVGGHERKDPCPASRHDGLADDHDRIRVAESSEGAVINGRDGPVRGRRTDGRRTTGGGDPAI